ncbi:MAG: methyl-accepting chemotaxis protein [Gorillibacterium sp.]|nr:methyl-accepting chemotaxis protein [Gorillibacterium sp.]
MKMNSVKAKTLMLFLPAVLILFFVVLFMSYRYSQSIIADQSRYGMNEQLSRIMNDIRTRIVAHTMLPEMVAKTIVDTYDDLTLVDYQTIMKNGLEANAETFGMGIFFQANAYQADTKYFSTYAYRDQGGIVTTEDYSEPSYDYLNQDWYKIAVDKQEPLYSDPYYDETLDVTMVTTSAPVYNLSKQFIGVATGDIDLTTLQKMIADLKIGNTGWSFLLNQDGTYMAGPEKDKIMKIKLQEDSDATKSAIGKRILEEKNGSFIYKGAKGKEEVYYKEIPETGWILATVMPNKELMEPFNKLLFKLAIVALAGILLIIGIILFYSRSITKQISKVHRLSEVLAAGDFTHQISISSRDEFGQMAEHFNRTTGMLREMVNRISTHTLHAATQSEKLLASSEQTSAVAKRIADNSNELSSGAESQLQSTEESARAIEELALGIQRIAESSSLVRDSSEETNTKAVQGNAMIQQAVSSMNQVNGTVKDTAEVIQLLHAHSQEIGLIMEVINSISNQTNLLSLNAGIEAARAGEHGRGFAVVAQEIRKLADQTKVSSQQVGELIAQVQQYSASAASSVKSGAAEMDRTTELMQQAGEVFGAILQHIDTMDEQIQEVSSATQEMSASSEQVNATIDELSRIADDAARNAQSVAMGSEEQLTSMRDITASAESLKHMVMELTELLAEFKV